MKTKNAISADKPYSFALKRRGNVLFYFGARHTFDPSHPQFYTLTKQWLRFIRLTKGARRLVLVEGGTRQAMQGKNRSIREGGEGHLITHLAAKHGIETRSPEPSCGAERKMLVGKFKKEEVQYYYFARVVRQWGRSETKKPFPAYIRRFLRRDELVSRWSRFDFSIKRMKEIHSSIFGGIFNERDKEFFSAITDPRHSTTTINKIAAASSEFRDGHIIGEIKKLWRTHNLFIIYGRNHAVVHEPVLRRYARRASK